jgi:hypothetical protein
VLGRCGTCPLLDIGRFDLDGQPAGSADQVVVVTGALARAVQAFALGALQRVGVALRGEPGERAIHGCQANARVLLAQRRVQALRAHETRRVVERLAHPIALPRVALHHGLESTERL